MRHLNLLSNEQQPGIINILAENKNHDNKNITFWYAGYRHMLNCLDQSKDKAILDFSSDGGTFYNILCELKANITSIDAGGKRTSICDEVNSYNPVHFSLGPGSLEFLSEGSFDCAFLNFSLPSLSSSGDVKKTLRSIRQALRQNGTIVLLNINWDKSNGKEFFSFKLEYQRRLSSGKKVTALMKTEPPVQIENYYWSKTDYIDFLTDTGFEIQAIMEPLIRDNEFQWLAEKQYPPFHIIYANKK